VATAMTATASVKLANDMVFAISSSGVVNIITKLNSLVLVRKRTIPTKQPQPADEVSANFS
jgi:hypothetical protein